MAILSDKTIKEYLKEGKIGFEPLQDEKQIQPSSVDMRLGDELKYLK
jgi:dCTP deaminase